MANEEGPVRIYTDSQYLKNGITRWIHTWKVKGWKKSDKDEVKNIELWKELDDLNKVNIQWEWIRGHSENEHNQRADKIAVAFSRNEPIDLRNDGEMGMENLEQKAEGGFGMPELSTGGQEVKKVKDEDLIVRDGGKFNKVIYVCLPLVKKFFDGLIKAGYRESEKACKKALYGCQKGNLFVEVYPSGAFVFRGEIDAEAEGIIERIKAADDRYLEETFRFLPGLPLVIFLSGNAEDGFRVVLLSLTDETARVAQLKNWEIIKEKFGILNGEEQMRLSAQAELCMEHVVVLPPDEEKYELEPVLNAACDEIRKILLKQVKLTIIHNLDGIYTGASSKLAALIKNSGARNVTLRPPASAVESAALSLAGFIASM